MPKNMYLIYISSLKIAYMLLYINMLNKVSVSYKETDTLENF